MIEDLTVLSFHTATQTTAGIAVPGKHGVSHSWRRNVAFRTSLLQGASGCLARRLPLQPTLHARILADGDVEPHPRRALEMRTKDSSRCEHDAIALRGFR
jgi:hypothetical protein